MQLRLFIKAHGNELHSHVKQLMKVTTKGPMIVKDTENTSLYFTFINQALHTRDLLLYNNNIIS